ncbi:hypothetical protein L1987_15340 [Smallanthus sonchifolius]|uniref:Uncharacterized protein n=1 Tax=Smallanthus sonchifolius TaxID=185202 RepID=A0ACB9J5N5_9ASTR|nr:hypothetical protein L1987_15340 [Smallanthus sonchifolius]
MPQEDEITSYVSCTSVCADSVLESENNENGSAEKGIDCVVVEDKELSEDLCVPKNENIPRENCILFVKSGDMKQEVSKIENISNKDFIKNNIFEKAEMNEKETKDSFFKRKFVKKPQQSGSRGFGKRFIDSSLARPFVHPKPYVKDGVVPRKPYVKESNVPRSKRFVRDKVAPQPKRFVQEKVVQKPKVFEKAKGGQKPDVKFSKPHRRRMNKQPKKLLFQTD